MENKLKVMLFIVLLVQLIACLVVIYVNSQSFERLLLMVSLLISYFMCKLYEIIDK